MAPRSHETSHLVNVLATPSQLATSPSQTDGIPADLERSILFTGARLTQTAGILLRLPQDVIAQAIVLFQRFWVGEGGGSLRYLDAAQVSAATIYLTTKLSAVPRSPRSVINTYAYLDTFPRTFTSSEEYTEGSKADSYYVSEGTYSARRDALAKMEMVLLRALGFHTHVALPYNICIHYLQALDVFKEDQENASKVAKRAFAHLNTVLLSPQLVYLTHQPNVLAVAAIYLAAKDTGVKLPSEDWWEVFDTDREELGFLVVAMISMEGFVREEAEQWAGRKVPTVG